ncbi:N-acetylmuramoyl-L-alanine amidase [Chryseomicrobium palamuruense]|uniref:N-acetylmuramoyl-L-alanine amidase n=1 Tax=Chryseomicrobium palamuruense TaxID=682973 RepID=A0ABV8UUZ5_9BACL
MHLLIDPGHGPTTPGKRSPDGKLREFECNYHISLFIQQYLKGKIECSLTTTGKRDVPLWERSQMANQLNVDVYVSIHANAFGSHWNAVSGIETYVSKGASPASIQLAKSVQKNLVNLTGRLDRGVKQAEFHVLTRTKMPAILVEVGFMTHRIECALLLTEAYQKKCAQAIARALEEQLL